MLKISAHIENWELKQAFRLTGLEVRSSKGIVVKISDGTHLGMGEAQGVFYTGETADSMLAQFNSVADELRRGISRDALLHLLPAGGARNAIDCALWDLECKQSGKSIWQLTGIDPKPVTTVFTIGIEDSPQAMADKAAAASQYPILKIKLDAQQPLERLKAIRAARPDVKLVVDANQGWSFAQLKDFMPACVALNLEMIEQPLARGQDEMLLDFSSPITLAADESCLDSSELAGIEGRYNMINIKLDKTGGLTEALNLAKTARAKGYKLMVGNMCGTSLSIAPSFVVAQLCDFVDIDGPLLLKHDHPNGLHYSSGQVSCFESSLWG
jgi:L-alanine-DL-glutamate epimerase-like enolase superfamily enzyme